MKHCKTIIYIPGETKVLKRGFYNKNKPLKSWQGFSGHNCNSACFKMPIKCDSPVLYYWCASAQGNSLGNNLYYFKLKI